jgi:hypothetical protein
MMLQTTLGLLGVYCLLVPFVRAGGAVEATGVPNNGIRQLVHDLGNERLSVRKDAAQRLEKIGKPALGALRDAKLFGNAEAAWRAHVLINEIQWPSKLVSVVDGMQFKVVGDKRWAAPAPGKNTPIFLRLEVTNVCDRPCRFYPGGARVTLTDSKGYRSTMQFAGNNHVGWASPSPPLTKGASYFYDLQCALYRREDGPLGFCLSDPSGAGFDIPDLSKGAYEVSISYSNSETHYDGPPLWCGCVASTPSFRVMIE